MIKNKIRIISAAIFILMLCFIYKAADTTGQSANEEGFTVLQDAIVRCAVQCYAIEGFYPPDVGYMEEHYGLIVDENKYAVSYSVFSSNIMPEVMVFKK